MKEDKPYYPHRTLVRLVLEACTPFRVGSGLYDYFTDAPVLLDANNLPYIPGSSIKGALRSALESRNINANLQKTHPSGHP